MRPGTLEHALTCFSRFRRKVPFSARANSSHPALCSRENRRGARRAQNHSPRGPTSDCLAPAGFRPGKENAERPKPPATPALFRIQNSHHSFGPSSTNRSNRSHFLSADRAAPGFACKARNDFPCCLRFLSGMRLDEENPFVRLRRIGRLIATAAPRFPSNRLPGCGLHAVSDPGYPCSHSC